MNKLIAVIFATITLFCVAVVNSHQGNLHRTVRKTPGIVYPIAMLYEDMERYPHIANMVIEATNVWHASIPVHFPLYIAADSTSAIPVDAIRIFVIDMVLSGLGSLNPGIIFQGLWNEEDRTIFLSDGLETWEADRLRMYHSGELDHEPRLSGFENMALAVAIHELGHALGLPHIIGVRDDSGVPNYPLLETGAIVVETHAEAQNFVMFPYTGKASKISQLEIDVVMEHLNLPKRWLK